MAFAFTGQYAAELEAQIRAFYETLSEKDGRRFAVLEAKRLGYGGITYIAGVLGCSARTIERAADELDGLPDDPLAGRIRAPGGGRKKKIESEPELELNLHTFVEARTAGDPDQPDFASIDFSPSFIAAQLGEMGTPVSPHVVRDWLAENDFALHKVAKVIAGGKSPFRNAQFENIKAFKSEYFEAGNPVFSIDTKAKELLGQLYREGRVWTQQPYRAFDHDFPSWATGLVIPHGIYDVVRNYGHINLGLSHDTSLFACDSFRWYWNRIGKRYYPHATSILWLCDCGGSNSANQNLFKQDLQTLVNDIGVEIRIAHYPSYCSKYNPIEHRFFPHVGRACQGKLFDTLDTVVRLMRRTATSTGLGATVNVIRRTYELGRKVAKDFRANMAILFDDLIPKWNYRAVPR